MDLALVYIFLQLDDIVLSYIQRNRLVYYNFELKFVMKQYDD